MCVLSDVGQVPNGPEPGTAHCSITWESLQEVRPQCLARRRHNCLRSPNPALGKVEFQDAGSGPDCYTSLLRARVSLFTTLISASCVLFKNCFVFLFHLFGRQRDRELPPAGWFPKCMLTTEAGSGVSQESRPQCRSPTWASGTLVFEPRPAASQGARWQEAGVGRRTEI